MKIEKILNNNVVIVLNDLNEEIILMGKGLGFQKKAGASVNESKIEKIYELSNQLELERIEELFAEIPVEIIGIAEEILAFATKQLDKHLNDTAFISVADHLHIAIERQKQGIVMKNFLLWDIKRFFPEEFKIGEAAVLMVEEKLSVKLTEDEVGFLALHIVNAEMATNAQNAIDLTQLIEEIMTVIKYTLNISFDENSIHFQRFMTHLKFFAGRVLRVSGEMIKEENVEDDLYLLVKRKYPQAFETTKKVAEFLYKQHRYVISEDEQVYFTIHLAKIVNKSQTDT
ncbi:MAG: PRD domain-containing protein [Streptococcaceae bacterium]|jgi:beta-glucoside operon transcriptional antiterminator|nr:PRD domain-containing protein [Streptococcaceae bacterium]